jgi:UDP-N-acetylglucosamine acyltransferase
MARIHPTAIVSPGATLADDVSVGAYSIINDEVTLGPGCVVGPHVVLAGPARFGAGNRFWQFASVGADPQDKKYAGERSVLEVGDGNVFRECVTVHRGTGAGGGITRIGSDNLFMAYTHVAHDCQVGSHCILANYCGLAGHVELDDWVILGGYSGVHQFCKIGAHAFLANNATATRDVPPFVMVAGSPAEPKGINAEGLKRRGYSAGEIANIKAGYRILYRSGLKLAEASEELARLAASQPELRPYVDFLPRITRSLLR